MATHNLNGEKRPEATGGAKGEVVTPQASEFLTLKQLIRQLEGVEVQEKEDMIVIQQNGLQIILQKCNDDWVYKIKTEVDNDRVEIYISSSNQLCKLLLYPKNKQVDISYQLNNELTSEEDNMCVEAECAFNAIKSILNACDEYGVLGGLYEFFRREFLDTIL